MAEDFSDILDKPSGGGDFSDILDKPTQQASGHDFSDILDPGPSASPPRRSVPDTNRYLGKPAGYEPNPTSPGIFKTAWQGRNEPIPVLGDLGEYSRKAEEAVTSRLPQPLGAAYSALNIPQRVAAETVSGMVGTPEGLALTAGTLPLGAAERLPGAIGPIARGVSRVAGLGFGGMAAKGAYEQGKGAVEAAQAGQSMEAARRGAGALATAGIGAMALHGALSPGETPAAPVQQPEAPTLPIMDVPAPGPIMDVPGMAPQPAPVAAGRTAEDFELRPEAMAGLSKIANMDARNGQVHAYGHGENGVYNHADIMERHGMPPDQTIPGFTDRQGNFVPQYPEDAARIQSAPNLPPAPDEVAPAPKAPVETRPVPWMTSREDLANNAKYGLSTVRVPIEDVVAAAADDIARPGRFRQAVGDTNKYDRAVDFLRDATDNGIPVKVPELEFGQDGKLTIADGAHRMAAAFARGDKTVPVTIPSEQLGLLQHEGVPYIRMTGEEAYNAPREARPVGSPGTGPDRTLVGGEAGSAAAPETRYAGVAEAPRVEGARAEAGPEPAGEVNPEIERQARVRAGVGYLQEQLELQKNIGRPGRFRGSDATQGEGYGIKSTMPVELQGGISNAAKASVLGALSRGDEIPVRNAAQRQFAAAAMEWAEKNGEAVAQPGEMEAYGAPHLERTAQMAAEPGPSTSSADVADLKQKFNERLQRIDQKQESIDAVRKTIADSVKEVLPADLQGRYLNTVREATTPLDLQKATQRIVDASATRHLSDAVDSAKGYLDQASWGTLPDEFQKRAKTAAEELQALHSSEDVAEVKDPARKAELADEIQGKENELRQIISDGMTAKREATTERLRASIEGRIPPEGPPPEEGAPNIKTKGPRPTSLGSAGRGIFSRFASIGRDFGEGSQESVTNFATTGRQARGLVSRFMQDAFGKLKGPALQQAMDGFVAVGYHNRAESLRAKGFEPAGVPDVGPEAVQKALANPDVARAINLWQTRIEPNLRAIRDQLGMPTNFDDKFQFNLVPEKEPAPGKLGLFNREAGSMKKVMTEEATGTRSYITDPEELIGAVVGTHYRMQSRAQLFDALKESGLALAKDQTYTKPGMVGDRRFAKINGREQEVVAEVMPGPGDVPDFAYVPREIVDAATKATVEPWEGRSAVNAASDAAIKASLLAGWEAPTHVFRQVTRTASAIARYGDRLRSTVPFLGSREAAIHRMVQMAETPYGEFMQQFVERTGSDAGRGFLTGKDMEGKSTLQKGLSLGHRLIFGQKYGADVLGRRVIADAALRTEAGSDVMNGLERDINAGKMSGAEAMQTLEKQIGAKGFNAAARGVNNSLGWSNRVTRQNWMNAVQRVWPYIGSESGIPQEIGSLVNVSPRAIGKAVSRGEYGRAAMKGVAGLLSGGVGTYLAMNVINKAATGRYMWENDPRHRNDVALGGGWYLSNVDPPYARAMRLIGANAAMEKEAPGAAGKDVGREALNEAAGSLHPAIRMAMSAGAAAGGKSPYITQGWDLGKSRPGWWWPLGVGRDIMQPTRSDTSATSAIKSAGAAAGLRLKYDPGLPYSAHGSGGGLRGLGSMKLRSLR